MIIREEVFTYVKEKYGTDPNYPWTKHPNYAVLRNKTNGKWYAVMMNVPRVKLGLLGEDKADIINLKCDPEFNSILRGQEGVLPAYHMNKEHWVSIVLDSPFPKAEIYNLIDWSYKLTVSKK